MYDNAKEVNGLGIPVSRDFTVNPTGSTPLEFSAPLNRADVHRGGGLPRQFQWPGRRDRPGAGGLLELLTAECQRGIRIPVRLCGREADVGGRGEPICGQSGVTAYLRDQVG